MTTTGDDVPEPFEMLQLLGRGEYFQVWKARVLDESLRNEWGRDIVVLKIPLDRKRERRLRADIEAWMKHRHIESPHLFNAIGYEVFRGAMVLVVPLAFGHSLRNRIGFGRRTTPLSVAETTHIALGVLRGLDVIHRAGLLHRAVRPENILFDDGVAKLDAVDLHRREEDDPEASLAGIIGYLAPEVIEGAAASPASDVWAFGITLYETLTGTHPFPLSPFSEAIDAIRAAVFLAPSMIRPGIDRRVDDIVLHTLARDPTARATVADLLERFASNAN